MAHPVYHVPAGDVLPIPFSTYAGATGASVTLTGLAVTDIEIYKDASMTQRASDAGYTLIDTDGIDIDGTTGIHGFTIDTGDNTDASFYTVGAWFTVVVSAVTVDSQTVNFIAAQFRIMAAETAAGVPKADVSHYGGTAGTFASGRSEVNTTHLAGTSQTARDIGASVLLSSGTGTGQLSITSGVVNANAVQLSGDSTAADNAEAFFDGTGYAGTNNVIPTVTTVTGGATAAALAVVDGIVDNLVSGVIFGSAATGTLSTTVATTDLTGYANDQLIGRVVIWLTGNCEGEASDITDYASSSGTLTFTALTTAPGNGDQFKVV